MYHSKKNIVTLFLFSVVLLGCSQYEDVDDTKEVNKHDNTGVVFRLRTNVSANPFTRSAEDSYLHEQGKPEEYNVNNARVYLFDAPSKLFVKSFLLTNLTRSGTDASGNIIYETEHVYVPQGTYDIFVTANTDRLISKNTESEFLADIDSISYVKAYIDDISKGIVMTNRASENTGIVIANNPEYEDNVVNITLERVLARIDIAKGSESFQLTDDYGKMYATITLDKFYIVNMPKYYYSYRHTAVLNSMIEPDWNLNEHFGNVKDVNGYVVDPYFFEKTIDASAFNNSKKYYEHFFGDFSNPNAVAWTFLKPVGETPDYNSVYCLENCTLAPAQKNGYSTGVIFRGKMEPYNNVFHLADDGNLVLVTDKTKYPEVLYYYKYKFYDSPEALVSAIGVTSLSDVSLDMYKVRKYEKTDEGYLSYYTYWIRHLDNYKPTTMGVMEFGIVRNNLYRLLITNVSGLGYPDVPVNTDTPDEGETYLSVVLNVKPWIVRDLTNIVL